VILTRLAAPRTLARLGSSVTAAGQ